MTKEDRRFFLDTNVLLAASDADRRHHHDSSGLLEWALQGRASLYASGQIFREYLVVATRPVPDNGLGMSIEGALKNVGEFRTCVQIIEETAGVSDRLIRLVQEHEIRGKHIHDANLAAVMHEHGLDQLVTLNPADFKRFTQLRVLDPRSAVGG